MEKAVKNRQLLAQIQQKLIKGELSYEEAKKQAQPVIKEINEISAIKTKELNAKYNTNRKPFKLDFINAMRNDY